ncbi:unnamed protein product, partial [Discosporangium mesarthrocarpum]
PPGILTTQDHQLITCFGGDVSLKFLPYQLWMVGQWPTMALPGNGKLEFDSGEGS